MPDLEADLFNLAMSEQAQPLMDAVKKHIADNIEPITEEFFALDKETGARNLQRVVDRELIRPLARHMLSDAAGKGVVVKVGLDDGALSFDLVQP